MDTPTLGSLFLGSRPTTKVVTPAPAEILPYKIPSGIIDYVLANRYAGDRNPGDHLLYLSQLCSLFKLAGILMYFVMRKLFYLSLKDKALDWYRLIDNSHLLNWQDLCLSFMQSFILFMKYMET